jgi:hypothetical protein
MASNKEGPEDSNNGTQEDILAQQAPPIEAGDVSLNTKDKDTEEKLVASLREYCERVLPPLWGLMSSEEIENLSHFLRKHEQTQRILTEFVDTQMASLCFAAIAEESEQEEKEGENARRIGFRVSQSALYEDNIVGQVLVIKLRDQPLSSKYPLRSQLQVTQLGSVSSLSQGSSSDGEQKGEDSADDQPPDSDYSQPQDVLYAYIHHAFLPYVRAYRSHESAQMEEKKQDGGSKQSTTRKG